MNNLFSTKSLSCLISLFILISTNLSAQSSSEDKIEFFNELKISAQWFLAYDSGVEEGNSYNDFRLKRGYITLTNKFNKRISARITQDVSVDKEGDGEGDIELRLKYGFIRYIFDDLAFFTQPTIGFGLVHRPWIDFEQKINPYRVQGTMFLERIELLSSADYGAVFESLIGGYIDDDYRNTVNPKMPGKYGSIGFGIFNGGGYHAIEKNQNKMLEGRLTLRPLPEIIPGFQLTYIFALGKGNIPESPDFNLHSAFLSYETKIITFTGQYFTAKGDEDAKFVDVDAGFKSLANSGYSVFADVKIIRKLLSIFGRYDRFNLESKKNRENFIAGMAYYFMKDSKLLLDYDYSKTLSKEKNSSVEFAIEFNF